VSCCHKVGAARCLSYDEGEVASALGLAVQRGGGLPPLLGEVLVKANLLAPRPPEDAVTTHPALLSALAAFLREKGSTGVTVSDSPGYIFQDQWEELFRKTGLDSLRFRNVTLRPLVDDGLVEVAPPNGITLSMARVARLFMEAPAVVNAAKLKTHVETEMTGCIKNLFGIADTATRKNAHRSPSQRRLAEGVVDLFSLRIPDFNVLDAVDAMEGDGPSRGRPVRTGWIFTGRNALAVDVVGSFVMGYRDPWKIPLIAAAAKRGLGPKGFDEIELEGCRWEELPHPGFRRSSAMVRWIPTPLRGWAHGLVSLQPRLDPSLCTGCSVCARVCPVDAIKMQEGRPVIDQGICVRCLCCHEMCPVGAMKVHHNLLSRLV